LESGVSVPGRWLKCVLGGLVLPALAGAQEAPGVPFPPADAVNWRFEGAIGPVLHVSPWGRTRDGWKASLTPGFFLRIGRVTVSNTSAFVQRRSDDVFEGLGADLRGANDWHLNAGLRVDRGHKPAIADNGQPFDAVPATVRARVTAAWAPKGDTPWAGWRYSLTGTTDIAGHHGGQTLDFGVNRDVPLTAQTLWSYGGGLGWGSADYLRRQYGITEAESLRTDVAAYQPGAGLRDVQAFTSWRTQCSPQWVAFWGGSIGRLLGPAAEGPLVRHVVHIDLNVGLARRF
jgi:hypothetical protein